MLMLRIAIEELNLAVGLGLAPWVAGLAPWVADLLPSARPHLIQATRGLLIGAGRSWHELA